jgi:hypothetical protein
MSFHKEIQTPDAKVWIYKYTHPAEPWTLAIATLAEPGSQKLSLGGFRIAPQERTSVPGFSAEHEAMELAIGMDEKVFWSRLIRVGGPLAQRDINRIVGGKCVLVPTPDSRVGQRKDAAMLDFAAECLEDCERTAGIHITTGQDLGHGLMFDGRTQSLDYLNRRFKGSVVADTSKPTAEGNYYTLRGMLRGLGLEMSRATIAFVGLGNIGAHVLRRARAEKANVVGVENNPERRRALAAEGVKVVDAPQKHVLLALPLDALVVNAAGGSLDARTVDVILENPKLKVICGSENLVMPNPAEAERLRAGGKVYCPTELGGMMGYLTAVEEYLSHLEGKPFALESMMDAAKRLEIAALQATRRVAQRYFTVSFEDAMQEIH